MERSEYDRIVETYLDTVYRAALGFCGSVQDAEDIVQNTFLKLLLKAPEFQDEEHIRRWLLRVAANESNSLWRSFWKKRTVSLDEPEELSVFSVREQSDLFEAVRKLPRGYREAVHLYYYEGYSVKETAEILSLSETAVQTRLLRRRRKLKNELQEAWK